MTLDRRYLLNREVQPTDAATRTVELARAGFVSGIMLRIECTNGATSGQERIREAIDRVEVIADGSDVLFSLEGRELERWQYVWQKRRASQLLTQRLSVAQELSLLIPFGRFLGDPLLNLDLGRYQRVELSVEFSPTISGTTFTTATFTISAIEYSWPSGLIPSGRRGFLRTRQVRAFTSVASGEEVFELDRRYPYMGALVYAREAAIADGVDITLIEVRENDGRIIPYTSRWLDAQMENQEMLDLDPTEEGVALVTDAETIDTYVSRVLSAHLQMEDNTGAADAAHPLVALASVTADRLAMSIVEVDEAGTQADSSVASALYPIHWRARGIGIGNAVWVPLAQPGDIDNPYMAPEKDKVQLALTNGAAGAAVRVSTQELVAA